MKTRRQFTPGMQRMYDACLERARSGAVWPALDALWMRDGSQRTGSGIREHFWNGYNAVNVLTPRRTLAAACYEAGRDYRKETEAK